MITLLGIKDALVSARASIFTGAVCIALCLPVGYCEGLKAGKSKSEAAAAVATVEVMNVDADSKEIASIERSKDDAVVVEQKQGLIDAVADLPDSIPSARRVALACERLRQQGESIAAIPACGGSAIGAKTTPES